MRNLPTGFHDKNSVNYNNMSPDFGSVHDFLNKQEKTGKENIKMKIFIICSVRNADEQYRHKLEEFARSLEIAGHIVHLPHRDTDQNASGIDICIQNLNAIRSADFIYVFFNSSSTGTHFDLGSAWALNKPIKIIENEQYGPGKSFARMIDEWEAKYNLNQTTDGHVTSV